MLAAVAFVLLVTLAAAAPDPGSPATPALIVLTAVFVGAAIGRARKVPKARVREIAENWGFAAAGAALLMYLAGLITDLY